MLYSYRSNSWYFTHNVSFKMVKFCPNKSSDMSYNGCNNDNIVLHIHISWHFWVVWKILARGLNVTVIRVLQIWILKINHASIICFLSYENKFPFLTESTQEWQLLWNLFNILDKNSQRIISFINVLVAEEIAYFEVFHLFNTTWLYAIEISA